MARATSKIDLIEAASIEFDNLWSLVDSMTEVDQKREFDFDEDFLLKQKEDHWRRDKNLRDVFIHLYEWHRLLIDWIEANSRGEDRSFLPAPYNWRTYGAMNREFLEKHKNTSYEESVFMLKESHKEVMNLIEGFTDEELFRKGQFSWTAGSTLGSYCVSATASHYVWAKKKIKKHIKTLL